MKNKLSKVAIATGLVLGLITGAYKLAELLGPTITGYIIIASLIVISIINVYDIIGMVKKEDKKAN